MVKSAPVTSASRPGLHKDRSSQRRERIYTRTELKGTCLLIGGTGTLGREILPICLAAFKRVRILSRSEHKQIELQEEFKGSPIDFLIGDIRDEARIRQASRGCDAVFHFAALKSIDKAEYDPWECALTNIQGTHNVVTACRQNAVPRAIFTSTDKAVSPLNFYGASKLCAEKLWIQGNVGNWGANFSAVRYGNVFGSNGSVIQKWKRGERGLTDPKMTRFFMTQHEAARFVFNSYHVMQGGEVFIPKMRSQEMGNVFAWTVGGQPGQMPIRPGEKIHETLISPEESHLVTETADFYIRWPSHHLFPFTKYGDPIRRKEFNSHNAARLDEREVRKMWASA